MMISLIIESSWNFIPCCNVWGVTPGCVFWNGSWQTCNQQPTIDRWHQSASNQCVFQGPPTMGPLTPKDMCTASNKGLFGRPMRLEIDPARKMGEKSEDGSLRGGWFTKSYLRWKVSKEDVIKVDVFLVFVGHVGPNNQEKLVNRCALVRLK